ncbi:CorA family divalent cation transporter [Stenotrophomonas sp. Iso1]|uniref:CorA family divalent cation transporter n=1 Tax=Stenotrophomonas sp. Iso1 TaxID=2977283 RepID=UPI0022B7C410|nr:CorA family divalent cation transporter [Stenotrophomonas sp. Iso1]
MIRSIYRHEDRIQTVQGIADLPTEGFLWIDVGQSDPAAQTELRNRYNVDPQLSNTSVYEDEEYVYLLAELVAINEQREPEFHKVIFVLGDRLLVTLHDTADFTPLNRAMQRLARRPQQATDAKSLMRMILAGINDSTSQVIESIALDLEKTAATIAQISGQSTGEGRELGVSDLTETLLGLNDSEELISNCLESQLALARVVRYLNGEVNNQREQELQTLVQELIADVNGVKEHAAFEHDKVRYLQNSVVGLLNIKQNQIVKVFTIITAVFLPPTLVATFYGMNFSVMPELSWKHGFTMSIMLTLIAALLPLIYIKRKGWLR